ncbi:putative RNA-binding Zn ribbon-like protein [Stackebrandtia endophytica]|uniref:Putative RNA-binding Zn ribbon-like protein n=1 Tax=Stackebrandtia endophytica TaxID=1496996 RepID=A0A543AVR2_9ACTN|nr:ABATE domain-containing protein [Stackebrandtia endophytica]TQL76667.1 putative RNA-binding Zn ribbon-like protein [Stackebrandtia endophytica]
MSFSFVSGNPGLDLTGTVLTRRDDPVDLLEQPSDLERWMAECRELPAGLTVDNAAFHLALRLREALYRLTLDRLHGRKFDPNALGVVNDVAAAPPPGISLDDTGLTLAGDVSAALSLLARSGMTALADSDHIKECGRPSCTRLYLDRSRGARRAWCGMDECGNRVKAAAYRARKRSA